MQVTYIAPEGDAQTVQMGGFAFVDGTPVDVPADARIAGKLKANRFFIVDEDADVAEKEPEDAPKRRGRPPKAASNE